MGTEKDVLQEAYHTHSQQLAELKNLVLQYIEVDDDFSFKFDDIRDLLENHLKNTKLWLNYNVLNETINLQVMFLTINLHMMNG